MDSIEEAGGEYDEGAREIVELSTPKIQDPAIQDPLDLDGVFDLNQQSLQYLRDHYGNRTTPDFITFSRVEYQNRLFVADDGPKTGFLDHGEYVGTITTKRWNRKHRFRTFFLNDRQLIVKYMGTWRVWLGVSQGFSKGANRTLRNYILHNRVSNIAPADVRESSFEGYEAHGGIMSDVHAMDRVEPSPMSSIATKTPFLGVSLLSNTTNYNIARIISDDWHYYGDTRPPFVQDREGMPEHKLKARIFDPLGDEYDDEFELRAQVWNSKASYWTVCIQEHKYIIKVVPMDRGHTNLLKLWLGHKQDFLLNPIGYLTSPNVLSPTGIQSIPKTRHDPMKVIGPIKRQYHTQQIQYVDTEVDDDAAEGELTATPIDTIPFHEISRFDAWLDELKEKFGRQIPPFVQEKGSLAVDQAVEVVEATFSGRYPDPARTSVSKCSVMVRSWNRNYVYFTYDLLAKRRIVVPFMVGSGRTAYHRWRSTEEGFDSVPLAFDIDGEDSATAAASDGPLSERPDPFKQQLSKKQNFKRRLQLGNSATHGQTDFVRRVSNDYQHSKIMKPLEVSELRHSSVSGPRYIDRITPISLESRLPGDRTTTPLRSSSIKDKKLHKHHEKLQTHPEMSMSPEFRSKMAYDAKQAVPRTQRVPGVMLPLPAISTNTDSSTPRAQTPHPQGQLQDIREQRQKLRQEQLRLYREMLRDLDEQEEALLEGRDSIV